MTTLRTAKWLNTTTALSTAAALSIALSASAGANPMGGKVVAGEAAITAPDASTVRIDQSSQNAVINWQSFNIGQDETTRFVQPTRDAWALNRVTGDTSPSHILGPLQANGNIAIVNPDGILFGKDARVDVGGLIATTNDIANDDFMAGRFKFDRPGNPAASVVNEGQISVAEYGIGAFGAPGVRNAGVITANLGSLALASGNAFTLDLYGDDLIHLAVGDEIVGEVVDVATGQPVSDLVKNEGRLSADGGTVALKAATARKAANSVVNNTGVIEARSVGVHNGKIVLGGQTASTKTAAAPTQRVAVSGTLSATNVPLPTPRPERGGTGGDIEVTGELIEIAGANIDTSGSHGGGTVLIGGDYMGGNGDPATIAEYDIELEDEAVPTASYVGIDADTTVRADATDDGDGGKIIAWSDGATITAAAISARGGANGGDGGFIETSGKYLEAVGPVDASATVGVAGTWLLDPLDVTISDAPFAGSDYYIGHLFTARDTGEDFSGVGVYPVGQGSNVNTDLLESVLNAGVNVTISTWGSFGPERGNIYLEDDIRKTAGGEAYFQLSSVNDIFVARNVDVVSTSGRLGFELWAPEGAIHGARVGRIDVNFFHVEARDGIDFESRYNMPDYLGIGLHWRPLADRSRVDVDVRFDEDRIRFWHDRTTATLPRSGIVLDDSNARGFLGLRLFNLDIAYNDRALIIENQRGWFLRGDLGRTTGAAEGNALNGTPEIVTDGPYEQAVKRDPPANGIVPVIEAAINGSGSVNKYAPTTPSGQRLIDQRDQAVLNPSVSLQDNIDQVLGTCIVATLSCSGQLQADVPSAREINLVKMPDRPIRGDTAWCGCLGIWPQDARDTPAVSFPRRDHREPAWPLARTAAASTTPVRAAGPQRPSVSERDPGQRFSAPSRRTAYP